MPEPVPSPVPPPRRPTAPPPALPLWPRLPADRRRQLSELLGQLLARLHEARRAKEGSRD